jgi:GTPase
VLPVPDERKRARDQLTVFHISTVFHDADESAPVVAGLLTAGTIVAEQDVYVGPVLRTNGGEDVGEDKAMFVKAKVVSVHTSLSQQSARVCAGQSCSLALQLPESCKASDVLRRGAVLLCDSPSADQCLREFDVSVSDLVCFGSLGNQESKPKLVVRVNARFMCHMNAVKQVVRVVKVEQDDRGSMVSLRLCFEKHIEFVKEGTTCMLRNANVVVVANVVCS